MHAPTFDSASLTVAFQPIVDLKTGDVHAYELLGRARPASAAGPMVLLERAAAEGRLLDLDHAWREVAIRAIAHHGADRARFWFLNIDTRIVQDPAFVPGFTRGILDAVGLSPDRIVLELTEHGEAADLDRVEELVPHYRAQGFRIAMDDVGVAASGLSTLVRLCPDVVKVDGGLVRGVATHRVRRHLVCALVDFARASGMTLVAEGVEDPEDLRVLVGAGVRYAQGWLLGRPAAKPHPLAEPVRRAVREVKDGPDRQSAGPVLPARARSMRLVFAF
jgi:EAL domain-containing protein (putative c-di-GMP-specific phosphodiesterase class I)